MIPADHDASVSDELEQLEHPPIIEVICGFLFPKTPVADFFALSDYWAELKSEMPKRELHPPVSDAPGLQVVEDIVGPVRLWMVAADGALVLQLQHDRVYLNWRARGAAYPRFNDHGGQTGLLHLAMDHFDRFSEHLGRRNSLRLEVTSIQLAKIDHFVETAHWVGFEDLTAMLPWTKSLELDPAEDPKLRMEVLKNRPDGRLTVSLGSILSPDGPRTLRLETRRTVDVRAGSDLRADFKRANAELNRTFAMLVPEEQRRLRFGLREPRP